MQSKRTIHISESVAAFEHQAAREIARAVQKSIVERGTCFVVLSGGETPRGVYKLLGADPLKKTIEWQRVHLFFTDERCVPPDDPQSNYGMVAKELVSQVPIPPDNVHRMRAELGAGEAAAQFERELRTVFGDEGPNFDVILLGIGGDGHTASLFPSTDVLTESRRWVCAVFVPRLNRWRVTLTFQSINRGKEIFVLATGRSKASVVERAINAATPTKEMPITLVHPPKGTIRWMLDREAALDLSTLNP